MSCASPSPMSASSMWTMTRLASAGGCGGSDQQQRLLSLRVSIAPLICMLLSPFRGPGAALGTNSFTSDEYDTLYAFMLGTKSLVGEMSYSHLEDDEPIIRERATVVGVSLPARKSHARLSGR